MSESLIHFLAFVSGAYLIIKFTTGNLRWRLFAFFQTTFLFYFIFNSSLSIISFISLLAFIGIFYQLLVSSFFVRHKMIVLASLATLFLVVVKLVNLPLIGASYISFRLIYLVSEFENETIARPTFSMFLVFLLFFPTLAMGPISPSYDFFESFGKLDRKIHPISTSVYRTLVGFIKCYYLPAVIGKIGFIALWKDSYNHGVFDFITSAVSYFAFLYFNFSGYCDIAIGTAGLLGVRIKENFNSPFLARNLQEYWTRWHITLSEFIKEMVYSPLLKWFVTKYGAGPKSMSIGIPAITFVTFIVLGLWHGLEFHFILFGILQALGIIIFQYYGKFLKSRLSPGRFVAYRDNRYIILFSRALTLSYMTLCLVVFDNKTSKLISLFTQN